MKVTSAVLAVASLAFVAAQSAPDANSISDVEILNYALTLEHLENAFYSGVLKRFNEKAFRKAGYPRWVYQRVQTLAAQEANHVAFLSGALGSAATKPCRYSFPYNTVGEALGLSRVLESVGVSAYLGAAADIDNDAYLTAAGSILTVEARHQAVIAEINGGLGFPSPYDTPLDYSQVYSLAAPFIKSCPKTNPALPVTAFPALTVSGKVCGGKKLQLKFKCNSGNAPLYAHFLNGLNDITVLINPDHTVVFPKNLAGVVYLVVSTSETLEDSNTVAGPAYIQVPDTVDPSFSVKSKSNRHH